MMLVLALLLGPMGYAQGVAGPLEVPAGVVGGAPKVTDRPLHGRAALPVGEIFTLSVTFDQDMRPGGYSFMRGGTPFPEVVGKPRYDSKRTAAVEVRLAKDTDYVVGIGRRVGSQFVAAATGMPAEPSRIVFSSRPWPLTAAERTAALAGLSDCLPSRYSHTALVGIPWGKRVDAREEEILMARSALDLGLIVQDLVGEAGDPHLYVSLGDHRFVPPSDWRAAHRKAVPDKVVRPNWNALGLTSEVRRLGAVLPGGQASGPTVVKLMAGADGDSVGYVWIPDWSPSTVDAAIREIGSFGKLHRWIIDVRGNTGGDEQQARRLAGLFVDQPVVYAKRRSLNALGELGPMQDAILKPNPGRAALGHLAESDVAVLMGPDTMSSSESFCLMMKAGPAALCGEATFGSSGNPKPFQLAPGVTLMVPSWVAFDLKGNPIERRGVAPDLKMEFPTGKAARREDPVLRLTVELLQD